MCIDGRVLGSKLVSFAKGFSKHPHILAIFRVDSEYLRLLLKLEVDRAEQLLRMCIDGRGLGSKLVSFAKGFSKHSYILAISKVDSEYFRVPFKVKVDYFILYSILVSTFVNYFFYYFL